MYDNINTNYENCEDIITVINAKEIVRKLEKRILDNEPTAEICAYLSKAYVFAGDDKKALNYAKLSVKLDKNYAYGYIRLAFVEGRLGRDAQCLKAAEKAEQIAGDNWLVKSFLVHLYKYLNFENKYKSIYEELEQSTISCPAFLYNMGFINYSVEPEDYDKAVFFFRESLKADYKDKYSIYYKLMQCYGELGNCEDAKYYANFCKEIHNDEEIELRIIQCDIFDGNYKEAIKALDKLYKTTNDKQTVLGFLSKTCSKMGNYKRAIKYLRFAEYTTEPSLFLYYKFAETYELMGEFEFAIDYYKKCLKFDKNDEDIILGLSFCYSKIGEHDLAEKYVNKAIALNSSSSYVYFRKGQIMLDTEQYEQAIESFKMGTVLAPNDVDFYQWISFAYSKLVDNEKSLEFANRALLLDRENSYSYFRRGWALQELGKYENAIEVYKKCIEYDNNYYDAYANISYCYSKTKDYKLSVIWADKSLMVYKDYGYAHYRKAWALQELGEFNEAMQWYSSAIELDPSDVYNYLGMSSLMLSTQANLSAIKFANKALLIDSNCAAAYFMKSSALSNLGKIKEAEIFYSKAIELGYQSPY